MLNIYIDESGYFVPVDARGSWSLSAALVMPTPDERKCKEALRKLKVKSGAGFNEESKYPPAKPGALICEPLKAA